MEILISICIDKQTKTSLNFFFAFPTYFNQK